MYYMRTTWLAQIDRRDCYCPVNIILERSVILFSEGKDFVKMSARFESVCTLCGTIIQEATHSLTR